MSDRQSSPNGRGALVVDARWDNCAMESLVGRFCAGDENALEILFDEYGASFTQMLRKIFWPKLSPDRCELIVNDAFLLAWQHCGQFVPSRGSLRAWLWRITYRRAAQLLRKPWFKQVMNENGLRPEQMALVCKCRADEVSDAPDDRVEPDSGVPLVRRAMEVLSPFERIILLADMEAADEIAASANLSERTGLAKSTIRCYRARAQKKVKAELLRLGYHPPGGRGGADSLWLRSLPNRCRLSEMLSPWQKSRAVAAKSEVSPTTRAKIICLFLQPTAYELSQSAVRTANAIGFSSTKDRPKNNFPILDNFRRGQVLRRQAKCGSYFSADPNNDAARLTRVRHQGSPWPVCQAKMRGFGCNARAYSWIEERMIPLSAARVPLMRVRASSIAGNTVL